MVGGMMLSMRTSVQTQLLLYFSLTSVPVMSWTHKYSNEQMNWAEAKTWCENQSMRLMLIHNENQNNYLKDNLPKRTVYYWIGLRKTKDQWTWQGNPPKMLEGNGFWANNEPNNRKHDEDCVEIYINNWDTHGKWNDEKCVSKKFALCYNASCSESSCSEHAECVENIGNYTCKCNPGFTGPHCNEAVQCGVIQKPDQGLVQCKHVYGDFRFNSSCHFQCSRGYILHGSDHLHCSSLGKWDSDPPECQVVECPPIAPVPSDVNMTCVHPIHTNSYNSTCVFSCDEGFETTGSHTTLCDYTGHWTHNTPNCTAVSCKALSVPDGGTVSCINTICTVQCPSNYLLLGVHEYTCRPDGSWSHFQPLCARCTALSTLCCCMFCCSYCTKRKKSVKQNDQEEVINPVYDVDEAPLENPLSFQ